MRFDQRIEVKAEPKEVWAFLWEVDRLARCLPGCQEAQELEPQRKYTAVIEERVGQFKSRFEMTVTVLEIKEQRSVRLQSEGQDRKLGTSTRGELEIKLEPNPSGGTVLDIGADIQVVGRIATFGQSVIRRKAQQIMAGFGEALKAELEG